MKTLGAVLFALLILIGGSLALIHERDRRIHLERVALAAQVTALDEMVQAGYQRENQLVTAIADVHQQLQGEFPDLERSRADLYADMEGLRGELHELQQEMRDHKRKSRELWEALEQLVASEDYWLFSFDDPSEVDQIHGRPHPFLL